MKLKLAPITVYEAWAIKPTILKNKRQKAKFWTEMEIALLIDCYNTEQTARQITATLGTRSLQAVTAKLKKISHDQALINS